METCGPSLASRFSGDFDFGLRRDRLYFDKFM